MQVIPISPVPAQTFNTMLNGQDCTVNLRQKSTGLYADLIVAGRPIVLNVICRDRIRWVRHLYLGFYGDLAIADTQGLQDPIYDGLGSRYILLYLAPEDMA